MAHISRTEHHVSGVVARLNSFALKNYLMLSQQVKHGETVLNFTEMSDKKVQRASERERERERETERVNDQSYFLSFITVRVSLQENNMDGITANTRH